MQDDLADLFTGRYSGGTAAAGDIGYRQGLILDWDAATGNNRVAAGGAILSNLKALSPSGSVILGPGVQVVIVKIKSAWFILGRVIAPGSTGSAFAGTVASFDAAAFVQSQGAGADSGFQAAGPAAVCTSWTGKWLVQLTASLDLSGTRCAGRFGFSVAGAQTLTADNARAAMQTDVSGAGVICTVAYSGVFTGAPGELAVQPAFRLTSGPSSSSAAVWTNRSLIVTGL